MEGFMEGNYWKGQELYVDDGKAMYKALNLGHGGLAMMVDKDVLKYSSQAKGKGVSGNLSGDGAQLGATYVVDQGGAVLMEFQQQKFGDHPTKESILEALDIPLSELASL
ncbi:Prostamide/prostaglandin F synthase (Prostamide/PG F synthase) (Prostamide/PGF synthase) (Peroxiredoxin-like 2B) [Durusdinium trenchii]|uniref:Prostamide/prostaglandin F synthase (Prostamide/PG F synthase) (Prostamide/PGF synthase) (Peroxiredoxin-like 2B) n=1 Tax=Durusdinium trenchii TaxID=1381693 RepID=A0ABP0MSJ1_9DINO